MEWLGATLKPYDLLPRDVGGTASGPSAAARAVPPQAAADSPSGFHVSFDDLLDVVNPLQHLPVVGTIYRAVTHDQIKTPEKIAGDTLYGGFWGLVSSLADTAFEKLTGHNFGDTVLALFTGHHDTAQSAVADAKPAERQTTATAQAAAPPPPTAKPAQLSGADVTALANSLARAGTDSDIAQRALYAYRRSNELSAQGTPSPF
jgi:hypothetical protein